MKKILLLLLPLLLFSCSSEETPSSEIVGTWQYQGTTEITEEGEAMENPPATCTENSTLNFSNNGSLSAVEYTPNSMGECVLNESATSDSLKWEEVSQGSYRIFGQNNEGVVYKISFPDRNSMWMIPGGSYDKDGVHYQYRAYVYKRI